MLTNMGAKCLEGSSIRPALASSFDDSLRLVSRCFEADFKTFQHSGSYTLAHADDPNEYVSRVNAVVIETSRLIGGEHKRGRGLGSEARLFQWRRLPAADRALYEKTHRLG